MTTEQTDKLHAIIKAQEAAINMLKNSLIGITTHDPQLVDMELLKETSSLTEYAVKLIAKADKLVDEACQ